MAPYLKGLNIRDFTAIHFDQLLKHRFFTVELRKTDAGLTCGLALPAGGSCSTGSTGGRTCGNRVDMPSTGD